MKITEVRFHEPKDFRIIMQELTPKLLLYFGELDALMVDLALTESVNNAWEHGNKMALDKSITVRIHASSKRIYFRVLDEGDGFTPDLASRMPPAKDLERGRGLFIIQEVMDHVIHSERGNELLIVKNIKGNSAPST
ncbi:ATP-binding protein [Salisediminibacterium beveridgei]|uniref:Response Regulator Receiver Protein n=1 Tax=Salisediminibacterium beveridgei TaxID=632773 RepID=A0A1D7QSL0_9BACI|nr:ATP-binding protein [Salisediminibacterium beveridgei]AOM81993.1 Response Regulator Receiver Protein [Salisediminibacterium beveridgei]